MPYNSLNDVPYKTTFLVFLFGIFGAVINYSRRKDKSITERVLMFFSDMISSVMLSIVSFTTISGLGGSEMLAVGVAGYVAYLGTRAIYIVELLISKKFDIKIDKGIDK